MQAEILYVDNHLVVANKPAHLITQSSSKKNLEDLIKAWIKKEYKKPGKVFLHAVHRLDKEVSGIVLFARTSKALSRLHSEMRARNIEKTYIAVVEGELEKKKGVLVHDLVHGEMRSHLAEKGEGKRAELSYVVLKSEKGTSLVRIHLHTGRYHQIRMQFSLIHHPIVGDQKYGSTKKKEQIYLHHERLCFLHPTTKKKLEFVSIAPFLK